MAWSAVQREQQAVLVVRQAAIALQLGIKCCGEAFEQSGDCGPRREPVATEPGLVGPGLVGAGRHGSSLANLLRQVKRHSLACSGK